MSNDNPLLQLPLLRPGLVVILTLSTLRLFFDTYPLYNPAQFIFQVFFGIVFLLLIVILFVSLTETQNKKIPAFLEITTIVTVFVVTNILAINYRIFSPHVPIHDGARQIEYGYTLILEGRNPYEADFKPVFDHPDAPARFHYVYSPALIYLTAAFFWISNTIFHIIDLRLLLSVATLIAGLSVMQVVREKILFLLLFFLNPIFLPFIWYGANDSLILLWVCLTIVMVSQRNYNLGSLFIALATATKIIVLPFVPIYFIYLYYISRKNIRLIIKESLIFISVNIFFYTPFLIKNATALVSDIFIYSSGGTTDTHHIAGVGGVQLLSALGVISPTTSFPFFLIFLIEFIIISFISASIFRKNHSMSAFNLVFVLCFLLTFSVSKIVQTNYLGFISQFLLIAIFIKPKAYV